jgi:hypothetical protein
MLMTYLAAAAIFLLAMTGLAVGTILGYRHLQCSCKGAAGVLGEDESDPCPRANTCSRRLVDDAQQIQNPALLPKRPG